MFSHVRGPLTRLAGFEHRGNHAKIVGPEHKVDMREALENSISHLLCHAPADADHATRPLILPDTQPPEVAVQLLLCFIADRTGVNDQHVRIRLRFRSLQTAVMQQVLELLGIVDVHLAPIGANRVAASPHIGRNTTRGLPLSNQPPSSRPKIN